MLQISFPLKEHDTDHLSGNPLYSNQTVSKLGGRQLLKYSLICGTKKNLAILDCNIFNEPECKMQQHLNVFHLSWQ